MLDLKARPCNRKRAFFIWFGWATTRPPNSGLRKFFLTFCFSSFIINMSVFLGVLSSFSCIVRREIEVLRIGCYIFSFPRLEVVLLSYVVIDLPFSITLGQPYCLHIIDKSKNDFEFTSFKEDFTHFDCPDMDVIKWLHVNCPKTCTLIHYDLIKEV